MFKRAAPETSVVDLAQEHIAIENEYADRKASLKDRVLARSDVVRDRLQALEAEAARLHTLESAL